SRCILVTGPYAKVSNCGRKHGVPSVYGDHLRQTGQKFRDLAQPREPVRQRCSVLLVPAPKQFANLSRGHPPRRAQQVLSRSIQRRIEGQQSRIGSGPLLPRRPEWLSAGWRGLLRVTEPETEHVARAPGQTHCLQQLCAVAQVLVFSVE